MTDFKLDNSISVSGNSLSQHLMDTNFPEFIVGENVSSSQTIVNGGVDVPLTFDTVSQSGNGLFSYSNGIFTIHKAGSYRLDFSIIVSTGFIQNLILTINSRLNGTNLLGGSVRKQLPLAVSDTTTYGCSIPFITRSPNSQLSIIAINNGINNLNADQMSSVAIEKIG